MAIPRASPPPIQERVRAEQANAWIAKWQARASDLFALALSDKLLTVHSGPAGALIYMMDWGTDCVMVYESEGSPEPYRFRDVQNALVFLDALLMRHVARLTQTAALVKATVAGSSGAYDRET